MSVTHRTHISELHPSPTASECAHNNKRPRGTQKRRTPPQPLPLARPALVVYAIGAPGPSRAACARSVDSIANRVSAAARTVAGCSWRLSAFERDLQVDLEHSAPTSSTNSPIVMVAPSPFRRDHIVLMRTARTPAAGSCKAASQRGEQKRSIVQWRSCFSTALWSEIARAMSTGAAHAGAEGALTGMWALFPARNWGLKSTGFKCTIPPPTGDSAGVLVGLFMVISNHVPRRSPAHQTSQKHHKQRIRCIF